MNVKSAIYEVWDTYGRMVATADSKGAAKQLAKLWFRYIGQATHLVTFDYDYKNYRWECHHPLTDKRVYIIRKEDV